jgi:tyrosyl-tRNA synthetase
VKADEFPCNVLDFLAVKTGVFPSKGEARKMVQGGGVSLNKEKIGDINREIGPDDIINGHYILAQKGKKNYFIINVI